MNTDIVEENAFSEVQAFPNDQDLDPTPSRFADCFTTHTKRKRGADLLAHAEPEEPESKKAMTERAAPEFCARPWTLGSRLTRRKPDPHHPQVQPPTPPTYSPLSSGFPAHGADHLSNHCPDPNLTIMEDVFPSPNIGTTEEIPPSPPYPSPTEHGMQDLEDTPTISESLSINGRLLKDTVSALHFDTSTEMSLDSPSHPLMRRPSDSDMEAEAGTNLDVNDVCYETNVSIGANTPRHVFRNELMSDGQEDSEVTIHVTYRHPYVITVTDSGESREGPDTSQFLTSNSPDILVMNMMDMGIRSS